MTTTQQTALQLATRKLALAQEQTASLYGVGETMKHTLYPAINTLAETLNGVGQALEAAGATYQPEGKPASDPHGLEALRKIEGSRREAQALLQVLGVALDCAEALDKKRGNWVGDMAHTDRGETPGTDYAEAVQALVLRLQGELGAQGGGRE